MDMKKHIIALAVALLSISLGAQSNIFYGDSYIGSVEAGAKFSLNRGFSSQALNVSTVHGRAFDNGFFIGGGVGLNYYQGASSTYIPIFIATKYSFLDRKLSPFVDARVGYAPMLSIKDNKGQASYLFINPAIGLDAGRFSVRVAYSYDSGQEKLESNDNVKATWHAHYISLAIAFNF